MRDYPAPRLYRLDPVAGRTLLVPVGLEGYDAGFNPTVEDRYEVQTTFYDGPNNGYYLNQWIFKERVRLFVKPLHIDLHTGKEYRCETCERFWNLWPDGRRPDETLLVRTGEHPHWEIKPTVRMVAD